MLRLKQTIKHITAYTLIITMMSACMISSYAAPPTVSTDESLYGNLDYYGVVTDVNIVKGVNLNGQTSLTDYGDYTDVQNMTSDVAPQLGGGEVTFSNLDPSKRFYYQCTPKDITQAQIPWDIDISYKLNGVPAAAETLAGQSGMVEVDVKATPRDDVDTYMQNNMMLTVAMTVDMTKNLSVEAPGAQIQSLGSTMAVIFACLPGDDGDFQIRIGTDSFETTGVIIAMAPGTLDALNQIKDLKEAKDKVKDAYDKIYTSTDKLMGVMDSMESGLRGLNSGLADLDRARAIADAYGDTLVGQSDAAIAGLQDTATKTAELVPHIETAQQAVKDLTVDIDQVIGMADDMRPALSDINSDLDDVQDDLTRLQDVLQDADNDNEEVQSVMTDLAIKLSSTQSKLDILKAVVGGPTSANTYPIATASDPTAVSTGGIKYVYSMSKSTEELYAALIKLGYFDSLASPSTAETMSGYYEALKGQAAASDALLKTVGGADGQPGLIDEIQSYIDFTNQEVIGGVGKDVTDTLGNGIGVAINGADSSYGLISSTQDAVSTGKDLLQSIVDMNDDIDKYSATSVDALAAAGSLSQSLSNTLVSTASTLSTINTIFKNSKGNLNAGTKNSIESTMSIIDNALKGLDITDDIRDANDTIKSTWDDEINDLENENKFLEMDPDATKMSFTSEKNSEPNSLQIVLRSKEISISEQEDDKTADIDVNPADIGPLRRMGQVFVKIFKAIVDAFSNL